ncbi:hypothetical protein CVT25_006976 [Psilocybe cyanescens]|uniref:Extracellular mutant protein 11 C-terminal domain-containing protein n=1 Tax=Psilocybe cyanescens TaxID=93625 RepID=A0A409WYB9_PSICY|nr:hypothetical protein CVT25_006976 [Psilocybe cyanescens]
MSARQQFQFPQAAGTGATFAPDPGNPLHMASQTGTIPMKEGALLGLETLLGTNGNDSTPIQRPGTSGLSGLMKKKSHPAVGSAPTNILVRPGTADPYAKSHQPHHINPQKARILAPTPQTTRHSPLLSCTSSFPRAFKIPSMIDHSIKTMKSIDIDAHISTSDDVLSADNVPAKAEHPFSTSNSEQTNDGFVDVPNLKFNQGSSQSGPRRVLIDEDSTQSYGNLTDHSASLSVPGHEFNEDGRIKASIIRKRTRSEVDHYEGDYVHPSKRFKVHQDENSGNENRSVRNFSPHTERPSSGLSHSGDHRIHSLETRESPLSQNYAYSDSQSQRFLMSPSRAKSHAPHQSHRVEHIPEGPRPLAKLLGQDPDIYVQQHMQVYDQLVSKWTDCTMAEWVAGANEVASQYHKVLDYVIYGGLHDTVNQHNLLLKERSHVLIAARKKLVEESGSVLGK